MSDDILDEVEKYKGPRTCPECGYQFPFGEFVRKYVMSYGFLKWSCRDCRTTLKCDFIKVQVYWLAGLLVLGFLFAVLTSYFGSDLSIFILLIPFFALVLLTMFYMKFEK